jgi:membrane fusion protein, multidrug efflux system
MITWLRKQDVSVQVVAWLTLALTLWLLSGCVWPSHKPSLGGRVAAIPSVPMQRITPETHTQKIIINGVTQADDKTTLAAEVSGQVAKVLATPGQAVKPGAVLIELEVADRAANAAAAQANLASAKQILASGEELAAAGYLAEVGLTQRRAAYQAAQQQAKLAQKALADTRIKAPFAGIIESVPVKVGDFLSIGSPVATLVGGQRVLLVAEAAQADVGTLQVGKVVSATLANGVTLDAKLRFVATDANPKTRTYRIEALLQNAQIGEIPTGMSARITVPLNDSGMAALISHTLLVLGDDGQIGVKAATQTSQSWVASFIPVTLHGDTAQGIWVQGLPPQGALLISQGASMLANGSPISPTLIPAKGR